MLAELVERAASGGDEAVEELAARATGPVAEQAFLRWQEQPPPGAGELHVPIARIPAEAAAVYQQS
ncbi:hypothetical protein [Actinomadura hibisca]|uniref:hypothetical protein n=1 Tax=Actinomadura hibisca TaxID=68565 RepID=UPI0012F9EEF1|nr:hypothetical protein [Actinomadura hibisca]